MLTNSRNGHVHEVIVLLLTLIILERFQKLKERLLGHLTPAPLQVGKSCQPEVGIQVVGCRIEGAPDGKSVRVRPKFKLGSLGMLQLCGRFGGLVMLLKNSRFYGFISYRISRNFVANKLLKTTEYVNLSSKHFW